MLLQTNVFCKMTIKSNCVIQDWVRIGWDGLGQVGLGWVNLGGLGDQTHGSGNWPHWLGD